MIILRGVERFAAGCDLKVTQMRAATRQATAKALHLLERRAKENLARSSHRLGEPTSSLPGDPPALVSGNLRRSITVTGPTAVTASTWKGQVGPTAVYGRVQELGGDTGRATLPARPYMDPALRDTLTEIQAIFARAWTEAILK